MRRISRTFTFSFFAKVWGNPLASARSLATPEHAPRRRVDERKFCNLGAPFTVCPQYTPAFSRATEHTTWCLLLYRRWSMKHALCQISPWQAVAGVR